MIVNWEVIDMVRVVVGVVVVKFVDDVVVIDVFG